jgi:glucosamine--fructose-6-phosphate aminotransferase (isomerizing)
MASLFESEAAQIPQLAAQQFQRLQQELRALVARLEALAPGLLATIARGSSDNAAGYIAYLLGVGLRLPAASLPPSLASVYGTTLRLDRACVLAVSQSGESPDLQLAVQQAKAGGAFALGLVNEPGSALAQAVDVAIDIGAGREVATAATKSFMLSATAGAHLVAAWTRDARLLDALERLPALLDSGTDDRWDDALDAFAGTSGAFVVARGPSLPIAQELALKLKEVCGIHAEALSAAELMHGPLALAGPDRPAIVFRGDERTQPSVDQAVQRLLQAQATVIVLAGDAQEHAGPGWHVARVPDAGHPFLQPLAALYAAYPFIAVLARVRGRDPDRPPYLSKVTRTL